MLSSIAGILVSLSALLSGITTTLGTLLSVPVESQTAQVISSRNSLLTTIPAKPKILYHGFYFVEDDLYNIHYMSELAGSNNILKIAIDNLQSSPQVLADKIRQNKYIGVEIGLGLNEALLTNANNAREIYLQDVKKKLYQDSDLGKLVIDFHILEEEYTLIRNGFFNEWPIFKNLDLTACQTKYKDNTLNKTNCMDYMMKEGLEAYIDDIHRIFPGIPTIIVENYWGHAFVPPKNLDILGLDAYFIPTSPLCDATQKAKFDEEVTNVLRFVKQYNKPIQMVAGVFDSRPFNMLSQCQAQWYLDLAKATPEITSFNWFLYATVDGVGGVRNHPSGLINFLKAEGAKIVTEAAKPMISSATISPKPIYPNGVSAYNIVVTTEDFDGEADVKVQYALVNQLYQGPNSGQYRGYIGWSKDGDSVQKYYFPGISGNTIACTGGGTAAKAIGYGDTYLNLLSCSTTAVGTTRTTTFVVSFNQAFTAPLKNNSLSAWSADAALNRSGWVTFENFDLAPNVAPVVTNTSINPKIINPNHVDKYDISVTTSDLNGSNDVKVQYALVNQLYQGPNSGQYRGYIGWSKDGDSVQKYYFPGISGNTIACTGGGTAAKATGYGADNINLLGCTTSTASTSRTTVFSVSFNSMFTSPKTNNSISGWSADALVSRSGWQTFDNFSLISNSRPVIISTTINPKPIVANATSTHSIVVSTEDLDGEADIKVQYALVNQVGQGPNSGQYRGYIGWSKDGDSVQKYYFPGISGNTIACTGGGTAAKAIGYGDTYLNLLSCSTTAVGTTRTTTFVVSFNPSFNSPNTKNSISGWSADALLNRSSWVTFETFDLK